MVGINSIRTVEVTNKEERDTILNRLFPTEMEIKEKENLKQVQRNVSRLPNIKIKRVNDGRIF